MFDPKPYALTAVDIASNVRSRRWSMNDVAAFYLERTRQHAAALNTHIYFDEAWVWTQVASQKSRLADGAELPLAGVPVVIKDNICTKDAPTTCASKMLAGFRPLSDAFVIEKLVAAGAILFGKANLDEFAMGSTNETSAYGPVKNPWRHDLVPGGSSGGSAAVVAADLAPVALGSDTGGSIRQPAALCGVVGLKPGYGRVSRRGLVAYGSSLDQIGPLARTVKDAALVFDVISGHDAWDSTSLNEVFPATQSSLVETNQSVEGLRLGVVHDLFGPGLDGGSRDALETAIDVFKAGGAQVLKVELPALKWAIAAYYVIATAEASANLARFDGMHYGPRLGDGSHVLNEVYCQTRSRGFGKEVKQRLMLGAFALSSGYYEEYYAQAVRARQLIKKEFAQIFGGVDLLVAPAWPTTAFEFGASNRDPLALYLSDACTVPANLAGLPAMSVPCGFDAKGLPIGLQLMGKPNGEAQLLKGALFYEQATQWQRQRHPQL